MEKRNLSEDQLFLGTNSRLGKGLSEKVRRSSRCVTKGKPSNIFCVEDMKWPSIIQVAFGAKSFFSGGGRGIVRYTNGVSNQYHVLFPAQSFQKISKYLKKIYGAPSEYPRIWTPVLGETPRLNLTFRWRAASSDGSRQVILEIRQIDDLRWSGLPQTQYGVVRLYYNGEKSIFETLTITDLMMMQIRNKNNDSG